jgi:hypothetical protein
MGKTYLATKSDVQAVSADVTTINQQLNTAVTGIEPRLNAVEGYDTRITQAETDIDTLELQLNDPATGIVKQLVDVDTEINEAGTGIKARLTDLEQGVTPTTKFRTHTASGTYADGEVVQVSGSLYKANSAIDGSVTPVPFAVGSSGATWSPVSIHNPQYDLLPDTSNTKFIGGSGNYYRGGFFEYLNFMSADSVTEGNIDADAGSLGVFGETELALGHGNNNKDMTFTSTGISVNENVTVVAGKHIKFEDSDTEGKEHVRLEIDGNDLAFKGHANGVDSTGNPVKITYDNKLIAPSMSGNTTLAGDFSSDNSTKVYSIYQQLSASAQDITLVDNSQVRVKFIGTNVGGSNWFEVYNKSGVTSSMVWSAISDGTSSSGRSDIANGSGLKVKSPSSTTGERTVSIFISGRNGSGSGLKGVVVDIGMAWLGSYAVGTVRVTGAF